MNNLRFTDIIVFIAGKGSDIKNVVKILAHESKKVGLKINIDETKYVQNT